jgi:flagellar assembly factor FliW
MESVKEKHKTPCPEAHPSPGPVTYHFPQGLYGLEDYTTYRLEIPDHTLPFAYLQACEEERIRLLLAQPFAFYPQYEFRLSDEDLAALAHPNEKTVAVWVTVNASESLERATINLLAPIVLNTEKAIGRQVVLHNSGYEIKAPLFPCAKEEV